MLTESNSIFLAVSFAVVASFVSSLGEFLVRLAHTKNKENGSGRILWLGLFFLLLLSPLMYLASFSLINISSMIAFSGIRFIFSSIFNITFTDVQFFSQLISCTVIIFGAVLVAFTIHETEKVNNIADIEKLFLRPDFVILSLGMSFKAFCFLGTYLESEYTSFKCTSLAVLSGMSLSIAILFAKILTDLLISMQHISEFHVTLILILFFFIVFLGLHCMSARAALHLSTSQVVFAIVYATVVLFGSVYVGVFFDEISNFSLEQKIFFYVGIVAIAVGIILPICYSIKNETADSEISKKNETKRLS